MRHSANTSCWAYPHYAKAHSKEGARNGGGPQTDDSILENYNRTKKRMKRHTFHGGRLRKGHKIKVKMAVQDRDSNGKLIPDSYHIKHYYKRANLNAFESVHRRCAVSKRIARKRGLTASLSQRRVRFRR
uniref:Uncharacterized protein n=1 Tax=Haptolina ericina TaxID=156174 RepID=A0A7S3C4Y2_9EUKA|mmetsp:Transcript_9270/g.20874  ORF Transcript_9270/g.20874 Transcript_9270/m.20874 type:complete len:130 (+) Transcript_9270:1127-1516(+)